MTCNETKIPQKNFTYKRDGILITTKDQVTILSYASHGHLIERKLERGGPKEGLGEVHEKECGLHFFYHNSRKSWVVAHYYPFHKRASNEEDWFEDTIFIPDQGTPYIKKGYIPAKPGTLLPQCVELAFAILGVGIGVWIAALFKAGCSINKSSLILPLSVAGGLAVLSGILISLYYKSPERNNR